MAIAFSMKSLNSHSVDENGRRTYDVTYLCSATAAEGPVSVRNQFNLDVPPGTAFSYGLDSDTFATRTVPVRITPSRQGGTGSEHRYELSVTFDTGGQEKKNCEEGVFDGEPWNIPWTRRSASTRKTINIDDDRNGKELLNTAEVPYWPPVEVEQIDDVIILQGNLQAVDFFQWAEFKARGGAVNNANIGPFPERTLRIVDLEWQEQFYGTCSNYFACTVSIAVNSDKWDLEVVQVGYKNFFGIDNGSSEPSFLDANGSFISQANIRNGVEAPFVKTHRIHNEKDFGQIGFPMYLLST